MDLLRQQLAPITDAAWREIRHEARNVFAMRLSARKIVDVSGPHGLGKAAVNLGRLEVPEQQGEHVRFGVRRVLPLVELRARFELDQWELDNVDRGSADPDLGDLRRAAREIAKFEEQAVYEGLAGGSIRGLLESSMYQDPIFIGPDPGSLPDAVSRAVLRLRYADVEGPYALALGAALFKWLDAGAEDGYPTSRRIAELVEGPIVLAPHLDGGVVVSRRGGDAELTIGEDLAIGYRSHDETTVRLFFSESFTFRVLAPEAVVALQVEAAS